MSKKELAEIRKRIKLLTKGPVKQEEMYKVQRQVIFEDCPRMLEALEETV